MSSSGVVVGGGSSSSSSSEQLCYVHCNLCDTVLAVSVPSSVYHKTVTVRCGYCTNLLPITVRNVLPSPSATTNPNFGNHLLSSSSSPNLLPEGSMSQAPNISPMYGSANNVMDSVTSPRNVTTELPRPPTINRPPEKRQRVPSAYNRFIKDEIQRIKAGNPDISHREAFSAAAKNWAHFPHIRFGLMTDQSAKRTSNMRTHPNPQPQEGGQDVGMKNGYFAAPAKVGVFPH